MSYTQLRPKSTTARLITLDDAPVLAELLRVNRDFLAPWEPIRPDDYFTVDGQRTVIGTALGQHEQGVKVPHVILDDSGRVVGRITLYEIVRGPFQSGSLGYWVSAKDNGRGLATAAVRDILRLAFDDLRLHRVQAGTLLDNVRSQRVLERNGFVRFGVAPSYLNVARPGGECVRFVRIRGILVIRSPRHFAGCRGRLVLPALSSPRGAASASRDDDGVGQPR